jgi:hypothetical protein
VRRDRIEDQVFHVSAFGSEVTLLPLHVARDAEGDFAQLPGATHKFPNGMLLAVEERRSRSTPAHILLTLSSESPALPQARALFGKLGGDPNLVRTIAPSSWSLALRFDADGHYVERSVPARRRNVV